MRLSSGNYREEPMRSVLKGWAFLCFKLLWNKRICFFLILTIIFVGCNSQKKAPDNRVYNSLSSLSLLNLTEGFLPKAGNCKIWFPDYAGIWKKKISQIIINNDSTKESPICRVLEMIKVKDGFSKVTLLFR